MKGWRGLNLTAPPAISTATGWSTFSDVQLLLKYADRQDAEGQAGPAA